MLIVYLVGLLNPKLVEHVMSNRAYTVDDVEFLSLVLGEFKKLILTPAILTEVSNLSAARLPSSQAFFELLAQLLPTDSFSEQHPALAKVALARGFVPFGFTDATIEEIASSGIPVFTDDANLYQHLAGRNVEVFNYNHIRMFVGNQMNEIAFVTRYSAPQNQTRSDSVGSAFDSTQIKCRCIGVPRQPELVMSVCRALL
jgi:hypothetical protein